MYIKGMKTTLLITLLVTSISAFSKISGVYKTSDSEYISYDRFLTDLPTNGHVVMGEFHNDPLIQNAQAQIISEKVQLESLVGKFSVMWEFLNYTDQESINEHYENLKTKKITPEDFIASTAGKQNLSYAPIFSVAAINGGDIAGINLPRSLKQAVVKGGIQAIPSHYIPVDHYTGGEDYLARFKEAMGAHVPAEKVPGYFLAQCLTDSVMAEQIHLNYKNPLNFVVAGSFHTDFFDGTVVRLMNTYNNVVTLKIINKNSLSQEDMSEIISGHAKYGIFADYIIITE
jgi:uncharacterized iron-regulated protein